jgi:hypothetical protein
MVDGFLPIGAQVESFYVPYFCDTCDAEHNVLFTVGEEIQVSGAQVKVAYSPNSNDLCGKSGCEIELDVMESKYFQFLKRN